MQRLFGYLFFFLPYLIVFIGSLSVSQDPDLGWHLKYGEYFFTQGHILRENIFSQMMPEFRWVNSSWVTDLISYSVFTHSGFFGLTILGSLIVTLTYFFFSRWAGLTPFEEIIIFPLLLFFMNPLISISFRGQLLSLLFLGIQFYLLAKFEKTKKFRWLIFIPLLFMIWTNVHGQFFMGLALLGLWIMTRFIFPTNELPRIPLIKIGSAIFFVSMMAALINPFGFGVYDEALTHLNNKDLKFVAEYLPINERSNIWGNHFLVSGIFVMGLAYAFFSGEYKKILPDTIIIGTLYVLSFFVRRYSWPFYLFTPLLIQPVVKLLQPPSPAQTKSISVLIGICILAVVIIIKQPFTQYTTQSWDDYCRLSGCSPKASETLQNLHSARKLFSMYDWGGYLIWNYPEIRPTIDGRMHLWRDANGYSAFEDYYAYEQNKRDIDQSDYDLAYISIRKPIYKRLEELRRSERWSVVYKDQTGAIYQRTIK